MQASPLVSIIMGSTSDLPIMEKLPLVSMPSAFPLRCSRSPLTARLVR